MAAERSLIYSQLFSQRSHYALVIEYKSRKVPSLSLLSHHSNRRSERGTLADKGRAQEEVKMMKFNFSEIILIKSKARDTKVRPKLRM